MMHEIEDWPAKIAKAVTWLLGVPGSDRTGQVLDFMGSDFRMYPDFDEFFVAMLDDNRLELERLQPEGNP